MYISIRFIKYNNDLTAHYNISKSNFNFSESSITGYNGKSRYISYANGIKEEYNYIHFTNVPFTPLYGNLYYNQSYMVPLINTYTDIYGVEYTVTCKNGLMGCTHIDKKAYSSGSSYKYGLNYWIWSSKSGSFDIDIFYHVIGK